MKAIVFILLIGFTTSCVAQKKIANLKSSTIEKASTYKYNIKIEADGISLNNISNKFTGVKQISPNLSPNIRLLEPPYGKQATAQLIKICANFISLDQLEELVKVNNSSLFISIKTNLNGDPLELYFYTKSNSILTLNQLKQIEKEILESFKITIRAYQAPFIQGSNFLTFDFSIFFENVLKAKKIQ